MRGQTSTLPNPYFYFVLFPLFPPQTHTHTSVAPDDYSNLINFSVGPFNNDVWELSFTVSIVNDSIPEDAEMFNVSLTLDPADQARLGNRTRVIVSPGVATVTIQDDEGM